MGNFLASLFPFLFGSKPCKILFVGLAGSGKTSILYYLKNGQNATDPVPTIGCNVESLTSGNVTFEAWDLGGQDSLRSFWSFFYTDTKAIIFVIDSTEKEELPQAKEVFWQICTTPQLSSSVVAVFCNKQDLPGALDSADVSRDLGLVEIKNHPWSIFKTSAVTGEGLKDGLTWVAQKLEENPGSR
eukprot:TRINITY_DN4729_c0_g1_i6.p1 TRINITY_DN4729_c0_g1~~TRINITY_DN4729_c0_g1_i6.p1  ORF type:complete len:203 (+),score=43.94 TRINITY_DN4729_c0_g1_i6:52-609(+)